MENGPISCMSFSGGLFSTCNLVLFSDRHPVITMPGDIGLSEKRVYLMLITRQQASMNCVTCIIKSL